MESTKNHRIYRTDEEIMQQERNKLNRYQNPPETIPNEATSTINPITGNVYEDQFNADKYTKAEATPANDISQYQTKLASMDLRDGKMQSNEYFDFKKNLSKMNKLYRETRGIDMDSIRDAAGFNVALKAIETRPPKSKGLEEKIPKEPRKNYE